MVNAPEVISASDLLARIRADVDSKRLKPIDLAREAGLQPSTVYSMLEPGWSNRAVDNIEALCAAYARIGHAQSAAQAQAAATT